ncbi:hypothetical protein CAPTEDRAFT_199333 [Capitella teleta]|uniref:Uncharacterized protein n=1 Tax=Capitella teleta TaxID=283909 RepID=R7TUC8_CAPTE|nr:hypothetical protein CAPTEDRAFT_199333 [Capitella teleta]|eukprot:ELT97274.1 hypothetical protein CAPTEDRAFT_199333 [Capitella teleta]
MTIEQVGFVNRKSYGESYLPRADCQSIILSNHSPQKLRKIKSDLIGPLELRFNIVRLDGDNREERVKYIDPSALTEADYQWHLRTAFYSSVRLASSFGIISTTVIKAALVAVNKIHRIRHVDSITTMTTLSADLMKAIPGADYLIILDVMDRFCTANYIPMKACAANEYMVELTADPQRDEYQNMVGRMHRDHRLLPTFNRYHELSDSGPMAETSALRQRQSAMQELSNRISRGSTE